MQGYFSLLFSLVVLAASAIRAKLYDCIVCRQIFLMEIRRTDALGTDISMEMNLHQLYQACFQDCDPGQICGAVTNFNHSDGCIYDEFIGRCYKCGCASTGRCIITWPITSKGKRLTATYTCECDEGYFGKNCDKATGCMSKYGSTTCIDDGVWHEMDEIMRNGQFGKCYCDQSCSGFIDCCFDSDC